MTNNSIKKEEKQDFLKFNNKKKKKNIKLADVIKDKVGETTLTAIQNCSYFMKFYANVTLEKRKLMMANSCNNRFCPMCAYRKARKDGLKHMIMTKKLKKDNKYAFLFLTLIAPSVPGEELENEIKSYAAAFNRFVLFKEFQKINLGYIRKLEITYNSEKNTYHPHYHLILCVNKSYFKSRDYIKQKKWLEMWKIAKRDMTITQVDVRKADKNSFLEIAKYAAKDSDYLLNQNVFDVFYKSLKGKKILTYNRIFKDLSKEYDDGKLDYLKDVDTTDYIYKLVFQWLGNEYKEIIFENLSEEEKNKMKNILIDEIDIENMEE